MARQRPAGAGSVYKQASSKFWWLAYRVGGKLRRESSGTTVKNEAERMLRAKTAAVDSGQVTAAAGATTLADLESLVLTDYENNGRKSSREMKRGFKCLGEHFGKDRKARDIGVRQVEAYKAKRKAQGKANATINLELAALRRGFRLAVKSGLLATRPDFSLLAENNARQGFFEADQFDAIRRELADDIKPVAAFLYWTGWRKGEVLGLEWRHVDRKAGVIRIETSKNRRPRTIPYAVLPALREVIDGQWKEAEALRKKGALVPWVFHRDGKRIRDILSGWRSACKRAGLAGRIPHDFRRTAARNMLRAGIPQRVAMEIGGWKTAGVFTRYAIIDEKLLAENLRKLAVLGSAAIN